MKKKKKQIEKKYTELEYLTKKFKTEVEKVKPRTETIDKFFNKLYLFATRDHLTGVLNRRILDEILIREMKRAMRYKFPLCIVMLDIDDFKEYNDKYGHLQGDIALRKVTQIIQKNIRAEDFLARFGGEEFIIVMPNTVLKKAKEVSERVRRKIIIARIKATKKKLKPGFEHVTVSMGISQLTKKGIKHMLNQADLALYKAKHKGKNLIYVIKK